MIPDALKYVRPVHQSELANGIKVVSEPSQSYFAEIGVFVKAGVRNETMANTGIGDFIKGLVLKGTETRSGQ